MTASYDQTARIWSIDGTPLHTLAHDHFVMDAAFSPDGKTVVTGSASGKVWFWDAGSGHLVRTTWATGVVWGLDIRNDGAVAVAASTGLGAGQKDPFWDINGGRTVKLPPIEGTRMRNIPDVAFGPSGNRLLFVGDVDDRLGEDGITLHSVEEGTAGKLLKVYHGPDRKIWGVAWHPSGRMFAARAGSKVVVWDVD